MTHRCCYCINVVVVVIENVVGGYDHNAAQIFAEKEKQCLLKYINKTLVGIYHNYYIETRVLIY